MNKSIIKFLLIIIIVSSISGLTFASESDSINETSNGTSSGKASAKISINFDRSEAKVGDTVIITVAIINDGNIDLTNIMVLVPLPEGLQYLSHATDTSKALYSAAGVWDVGNLRTTSRLGGVKYLYLTAKVLPSAEGKNLIANARYLSIEPESTDTNFQKPGTASSTLRIEIIEESGNGNATGNGTGNMTGGNSSTGNNQAIINELKNTTSKGGLETLKDLSNLQNEGKAYEVTNDTSSTPSNDPGSIYAIITGFIFSLLILVGYFKGVRG
ncbi:DUF11 domain-containing protein [Methanobacterium alkalithermotolerans]|uniref:DUF11 domain-containing protein n=1 Tax=Methanobacterium alkalithermotolerans TaxID=2731220 RepID=A0A8T8K6M2_9EURY|nr:DUF11 domain-containing protein [Methanobacterium alkalithermotolerans]QUH23549.1 DUF11 domain-containing protein [Methanobacterium alkalithermotolerans]